MEHSRNNPFNSSDEEMGENPHTEDVSKMKKWVSLKLKELEHQNIHLKEENRKFNEELTKLKQTLTPEVQRKFNRRNFYTEKAHVRRKKYTSSENVDSSSSDEEYFMKRSIHHKNLKSRTSNMKSSHEKICQPRIEGTNITLLSGTSRPLYTPRAGSLDRKLTRMKRLNFTDLKKQKALKKEYNELNQGSNNNCPIDLDTAENVKPPTPPLHRCPSWESRIYEIAHNGIKSAISTPMQTVKHFGNFQSDLQHSSNPFANENILPIFKNNNGRLEKISFNSFDESMSSDFESFTFLKSSTTSSGNESDFTNELKMRIADMYDSDSDQDYALPPDALALPMESLKITEETCTKTSVLLKNSFHGTSSALQSHENKFDKSGYLLKLSKTFKTWKRRWFLVKDGKLSYYKSQQDFLKSKLKLEIILNQSCKLIRLKEFNFVISYKNGKKHIQLSADSAQSFNEWTKVIVHSLTYQSIFQLQENQLPIIESYLIKVRFGHSIKCWAALYASYLVYFDNFNDKVPLGYTDLKGLKIQQINSAENIDDSLFTYDDAKKTINNSISIHANDNSEPIYLLFFSKPEFNLWLYHMTSASSNESTGKTAFENVLGLLISVESSLVNNEDFYKHNVWNNSAIVFTNENISEPLTSLSNETLKCEAVKMFKSIQLFISVPIESAAIDYHVSLIQNSLKVCFSYPDLQNELYFQLIKQSTPEEKCKEFIKANAIHMFLCSPHSIFNCEEPSSEKSSPSSGELSQSEECERKKFSALFLQCFQFLAITISIFAPRKQVLWLLRHHLNRSKDPKSELGKYAFYCERALQRVLINGPRKQIPSRMEVLSILQRNPFKHSMPHSIPVHFPDGSYQVIGFDGSSTISEFVQLINAESGIRDNLHSGFALYSDDPLDEDVEHLLNLNYKLADIISHWETNLRKYHLGKFESTKVIKLIYKHRLCLKKFLKNETDKERRLWVFEINNEIVAGRFPITLDLAIELMTLLIQIECGDFGIHSNVDALYERALQQFMPLKFRDTLCLKELILKRWSEFSGRSALDCVRIYLNCTRKWPLCGSRLYLVKVSNAFKFDDLTSMQLCKFFSQMAQVWIAVSEESVDLLDVDSFASIMRIPNKSIINFGGYKAYFMIMVNGNMLEKFAPGSDLSIPFTEVKSLHGQRLLFSLPKRSIMEITHLLATYINQASLSLDKDS